ncbi:MAG: hypothetical protein MJ091_04190 [Clostridia bacterium]|nr:hypothetical protein [Clostridia bacterium]
MKRLVSVLMVLLICLLCSCKSKEETVSSNIESTAYSKEQNGNISSKSNLNTSSNNSALKGESHPETTNTKETEEQYVFQELQNDDFEDSKELLCEETVKCYSFNGDCYRMPVFSRLTYTDKKSGITLPYVLYVPKQKEAGGCPVYLFLHGAGERGDTYNHYYSQIQRAFSVAGDYLSRAIVIAPSTTLTAAIIKFTAMPI